MHKESAVRTHWTPGPWKLGKCRDGAAGIWSESGHFADVFYNPEDDDGGELNVEDDHRAMATIRLICAAPEMAELIARWVGIRKPNVPWTKKETERSLASLENDARALLAKIKGGPDA